MKIQVSRIVPRSSVDGPGLRTVLFVQGCPLACTGCQNRALWDPAGGTTQDVRSIALTLSLLANGHGNVTISGGEPMQQPGALAMLVTELRALRVKHIIVYSGYTWEEIHDPAHPAYPWLSEILSQIDVLVDGRYVKALDDPLITYRGSRNQRPIDVPATLQAGEVVTRDWNEPEIVITETGDLLMPIGLARQFAEIGYIHNTRMCGQVRG